MTRVCGRPSDVVEPETPGAVAEASTCAHVIENRAALEIG
jgi:hypothetical protein